LTRLLCNNIAQIVGRTCGGAIPDAGLKRHNPRSASFRICVKSFPLPAVPVRVYIGTKSVHMSSQIKLEESEMTDLLPAEAGANASPQPARHWKEAAAEGRAGRTDRIAREVEDCLGVAEMPPSDIRADRRLAVATALADITPGDEVEGQLTAQLLTVHGMAMDCARAARDTLKEERVRLAYLTHAARMVSLYARHAGN